MITEAQQLERIEDKIKELDNRLNTINEEMRVGQFISAHFKLGQSRAYLSDIKVDVQRSVIRLNGGKVQHSTVG